MTPSPLDSPFPHTFGDPQQRLLRGIPAFAALPAAAREELAARLTEQSFPNHAVVLDEGETADRLFLIEEGEVEVSVATPEGRVPLSRLSDGEMFGEIGLLLPGHKRTARVTAVLPLLTSTLTRRHLMEVIERYPEARNCLEAAADHALLCSFVKSTRPFESLTPERLRYVGSRMKPVTFEAGTTIFTQGDPADVCYLLRRGLVEIIRSEPSGADKVFRPEIGEIIGESALLTSTPRNASLVAVERAELLALRREELIDVLDADKKVAAHIRQLIGERARPLAKEGIVLQPRPTAADGTIWVLVDPSRAGSYHQLSTLGHFVWRQLDGTNSVAELADQYGRENAAVAPEEIGRIMAELVSDDFAEVALVLVGE